MNRILSILILALVAITANAQDDFNPTLPGEPNALYKVTVGISHSDAGTVSGNGSFSTGSQITISRNDVSVSASSTVFYKFKYWTLNGEEYTTAAQASSFTYTIGTEDADFEAVYEEEDPDNVTSKVYLVADPADACTFNISNGERYMEDNYAYLYYNSTSDAFKFEGWYENGQLITTNNYLNYYIGKNDATITARFSYEPVIPSDPSSSAEQTDIQNTAVGDIDGTGVVNVSDAVDLITSYLNNTTNELSKGVADVDGNDVINVSDAVEIIQIYLNNK